MAKIKQLRKVNPKDPDMSRMERYAFEFAEQFKDSDIIAGLLLRNVMLTTGQTNKVEHKLNRPIIGWVVTRKNADANIWDSQATNDLPARTINLECSADVTVDLWVF